VVDGDLLTVDEAAGVLRVSRWPLYKMLSRGEVRSLKAGSRGLVPGRAINEFVQGGRRASA
jgi:excisionase family DNA binding protein